MCIKFWLIFHKILNYRNIVLCTCVYNYINPVDNADFDENGPFYPIIKAGTKLVNFTIPIVNDDLEEGDEIFTLNISPDELPDEVMLHSPSFMTVAILDDDCK